jgi:hypothetical protein
VKRLKILRVTRRTKEAVQDIDYADQLNEAETEWMEVFLAGYYGNDECAQVALTGSATEMRKMRRKTNAANGAYNRDVTNRYVRMSLSEQEDGDAGTERLYPLIDSKDFKHYRCTRCCKKADACRCPAKQRNKPYGMEDYVPAETSPEDMYLDEIDQATREKAYDLLPYGTNPDGLKPGHKVIVCLPHHYLKDQSGTVLAFRRWTNEYLIEADRPGLKHRDGTQSRTTLCWVRPEGLKRAQLSRV